MVISSYNCSDYFFNYLLVTCFLNPFIYAVFRLCLRTVRSQVRILLPRFFLFHLQALLHRQAYHFFLLLFPHCIITNISDIRMSCPLQRNNILLPINQFIRKGYQRMIHFRLLAAHPHISTILPQPVFPSARIGRRRNAAPAAQAAALHVSPSFVSY